MLSHLIHSFLAKATIPLIAQAWLCAMAESTLMNQANVLHPTHEHEPNSIESWKVKILRNPELLKKLGFPAATTKACSPRFFASAPLAMKNCSIAASMTSTGGMEPRTSNTCNDLGRRKFRTNLQLHGARFSWYCCTYFWIKSWILTGHHNNMKHDQIKNCIASRNLRTMFWFL